MCKISCNLQKLSFRKHSIYIYIYIYRPITHTCSICDGFVGVDGFVEFLAAEEFLQKFLDLRDARRPADQNNLFDARLVQLRIPQGFLHGLHSGSEQVGVQLLETGTGDAGVEVNAFVQRVDLDTGLRAARQGALRPLARRPQAPQCTLVASDVLLVPSLKATRGSEIYFCHFLT